MENIFEENDAAGRLKEIPLRSEDIAFKTEELIVCRQCRRNNPPTRLKCLYCGKDLELDEFQSGLVKPILRKLDAWEKGFNLIYLPGDEQLDENRQIEIVKMTRLEKTVLQKILELKTPLPLARAESVKECEIIKQRLSETGVETLILSDEVLNAEKPPKRLRGIEFGADKMRLRLFNAEENVEISREDLILTVAGAIFERKVEATEKRNRKGENKLLSSTETASDELLVDLYSRENSGGFRIEQNGFDFSCLGADKKMLAAENLKALSEKLKQFAPDAAFIDDYLEARAVLGSVWQTEERRDSKGLVREKFGKFNLGNVTTVSNLTQFTKYSRLQWHLL
jgi:hypothetical protein